MIHTSINLNPFGEDKHPREIASLFIANVGTNYRTGTCDYAFVIQEGESQFSDGFTFVGELLDYSRESPAIDLLAAVMSNYSKKTGSFLTDIYDQHDVCRRFHNELVRNGRITGYEVLEAPEEPVLLKSA